MKINSKNNRKKIIIILSIVATLTLGYGVFAKTTGTWPFSENGTDNSKEVREVNDVNYDPPTEEELEDSQDAKRKILEEQDSTSNTETSNSSTQKPTPTSSTKLKPATVGVSYADIIDGNLEVRAFTTSVIQGSGKCTATISKPGSATITETVLAFVDVSSTICRPIFIPESQLSPGGWNVKVKYSSPTHEGSSGSIKVEVR